MKKRLLILLGVSTLLFILVFSKDILQDIDGRRNFQVKEVGQTLEVGTKEKEVIKEDVEIIETKVSNINILSVGDIMFHMPQIKSAYMGQGSYDFNPVFKYVKEYIEDADIAIGNYETVTLDHRDYSGFPRFNSPKETLLALKETGFDIISTANNHSLDQGKKGIISTIDTIKEYSMKSIGTNKEPDNNILIMEKEEIKLGFLSYTYGLNGLDQMLSPEELSYMVNLIDEDKIYKDINEAKEEAVDLIVVFIHWGHEYNKTPSSGQIDLGEKMIKWGANIVLGSHPHVIQRSETIEYEGKDNFIIYSMGNFISNQRMETMDNPFTEDGVMVDISIEKDFLTNRTTIKEVKFIPTWVYKYNEGNKVHYEILPAKEVLDGDLKLDLNGNTYNRIQNSYNRTMGILEDM